MTIAADAQMENWAVFDNERLSESHSRVLRAAHHGSGNGTQWERLNRFNPAVVVVSSDLAGRDGLPDVNGASVFARYAVQRSSPLVVLTGDAGTVEIVFNATNNLAVNRYGD